MRRFARALPTILNGFIPLSPFSRLEDTSLRGLIPTSLRGHPWIPQPIPDLCANRTPTSGQIPERDSDRDPQAGKAEPYAHLTINSGIKHRRILTLMVTHYLISYDRLTSTRSTISLLNSRIPPFGAWHEDSLYLLMRLYDSRVFSFLLIFCCIMPFL